MLGWMSMFTPMSLWGTAAAAVGGGTGQSAGIASSLTFGFLLMPSTLTFMLWGRVIAQKGVSNE